MPENEGENLNQHMILTSVKLSCCEKDCPDRSAVCHGECERYKEFRAKCDTMMEERLKQKEFEYDTGSVLYRPNKRPPVKKRSY